MARPALSAKVERQTLDRAIVPALLFLDHRGSENSKGWLAGINFNLGLPNNCRKF
jgi:hypothetical protein